MSDTTNSNTAEHRFLRQTASHLHYVEENLRRRREMAERENSRPVPLYFGSRSRSCHSASPLPLPHDTSHVTEGRTPCSKSHSAPPSVRGPTTSRSRARSREQRHLRTLVLQPMRFSLTNRATPQPTADATVYGPHPASKSPVPRVVNSSRSRSRKTSPRPNPRTFSYSRSYQQRQSGSRRNSPRPPSPPPQPLPKTHHGVYDVPVEVFLPEDRPRRVSLPPHKQHNAHVSVEIFVPATPPPLRATETVPPAEMAADPTPCEKGDAVDAQPSTPSSPLMNVSASTVSRDSANHLEQPELSSTPTPQSQTSVIPSATDNTPAAAVTPQEATETIVQHTSATSFPLPRFTAKSLSDSSFLSPIRPASMSSPASAVSGSAHPNNSAIVHSSSDSRTSHTSATVYATTQDFRTPLPVVRMSGEPDNTGNNEARSLVFTTSRTPCSTSKSPAPTVDSVIKSIQQASGEKGRRGRECMCERPPAEASPTSSPRTPPRANSAERKFVHRSLSPIPTKNDLVQSVLEASAKRRANARPRSAAVSDGSRSVTPSSQLRVPPPVLQQQQASTDASPIPENPAPDATGVDAASVVAAASASSPVNREDSPSPVSVPIPAVASTTPSPRANSSSPAVTPIHIVGSLHATQDSGGEQGSNREPWKRTARTSGESALDDEARRSGAVPAHGDSAASHAENSSASPALTDREIARSFLVVVGREAYDRSGRPGRPEEEAEEEAQDEVRNNNGAAENSFKSYSIPPPPPPGIASISSVRNTHSPNLSGERAVSTEDKDGVSNARTPSTSPVPTQSQVESSLLVLTPRRRVEADPASDSPSRHGEQPVVMTTNTAAVAAAAPATAGGSPLAEAADDYLAGFASPSIVVPHDDGESTLAGPLQSYGGECATSETHKRSKALSPEVDRSACTALFCQKGTDKDEDNVSPIPSQEHLSQSVAVTREHATQQQTRSGPVERGSPTEAAISRGESPVLTPEQVAHSVETLRKEAPTQNRSAPPARHTMSPAEVPEPSDRSESTRHSNCGRPATQVPIVAPSAGVAGSTATHTASAVAQGNADEIPSPASATSDNLFACVSAPETPAVAHLPKEFLQLQRDIQAISEGRLSIAPSLRASETVLPHAAAAPTAAKQPPTANVAADARELSADEDMLGLYPTDSAVVAPRVFAAVVDEQNTGKTDLTEVARPSCAESANEVPTVVALEESPKRKHSTILVADTPEPGFARTAIQRPHEQFDPSGKQRRTDTYDDINTADPVQRNLELASHKESGSSRRAPETRRPYDTVESVHTPPASIENPSPLPRPVTLLENMRRYEARQKEQQQRQQQQQQHPQFQRPFTGVDVRELAAHHPTKLASQRSESHSLHASTAATPSVGDRTLPLSQTSILQSTSPMEGRSTPYPLRTHTRMLPRLPEEEVTFDEGEGIEEDNCVFTVSPAARFVVVTTKSPTPTPTTTTSPSTKAAAVNTTTVDDAGGHGNKQTTQPQDLYSEWQQQQQQQRQHTNRATVECPQYEEAVDDEEDISKRTPSARRAASTNLLDDLSHRKRSMTPTPPPPPAQSAAEPTATPPPRRSGGGGRKSQLEQLLEMMPEDVAKEVHQLQESDTGGETPGEPRVSGFSEEDMLSLGETGGALTISQRVAQRPRKVYYDYNYYLRYLDEMCRASAKKTRRKEGRRMQKRILQDVSGSTEDAAAAAETRPSKRARKRARLDLDADTSINATDVDNTGGEKEKAAPPPPKKKTRTSSTQKTDLNASKTESARGTPSDIEAARPRTTATTVPLLDEARHRNSGTLQVSATLPEDVSAALFDSPPPPKTSKRQSTAMPASPRSAAKKQKAELSTDAHESDTHDDFAHVTPSTISRVKKSMTRKNKSKKTSAKREELGGKKVAHPNAQQEQKMNKKRKGSKTTKVATDTAPTPCSLVPSPVPRSQKTTPSTSIPSSPKSSAKSVKCSSAVSPSPRTKSAALPSKPQNVKVEAPKKAKKQKKKHSSKKQ